MNLCDLNVSSLSYDSKKVTEGTAFFAIEGHRVNGNKYVNEAIANGAKTIITDNPSKLPNITDKKVKVIQVEDARKALANFSREFYNNPSEELQVIGVTGTKGKTSVTFMIKNILESAGIKTGIIGTVVCGYEGNYEDSKMTTPQSLDVQRMMRQMADAGCKAVVMEVSSQGLMQSRVEGIDFNIGVFTNVFPDHIGDGEHKDFEDYLKWKSRLLDLSKRAIINMDDLHWRKAIQACKGKTFITFGKGGNPDITYEIGRHFIKESILGMEFSVKGKSPYGPEFPRTLEIPLPGKFNVENALAAISTARALGVPWDIIEEGLKDIKVPGRAEFVTASKEFTTIVDYAHNGVALENLLVSLRAYEPNRLIVVFGCGGNRDVNRRYEMGNAAYRFSDFIIVTSDNPRNESPKKIIEDITSVMKFCDKAILAIPDRKEAIQRAINEAREGDIVVIAGKGHETYQIIKEKIVHFDDREAALSCRKE